MCFIGRLRFIRFTLCPPNIIVCFWNRTKNVTVEEIYFRAVNTDDFFLFHISKHFIKTLTKTTKTLLESTPNVVSTAHVRGPFYSKTSIFYETIYQVICEYLLIFLSAIVLLWFATKYSWLSEVWIAEELLFYYILRQMVNVVMPMDSCSHLDRLWGRPPCIEIKLKKKRS